ncbi:semaphorin-1A-like [Pollicipes pollicipes]|uniref:semaphorin-1A-like n=1 Tax=Pollicipes pollicipes TaxID=41117 RepID=UPI0018856AEF|nr:semaphorin-1A-like [Pollicipes pollicipes]
MAKAALVPAALWRWMVVVSLWTLGQASWQENLRPRRYVRLERAATDAFSANHSGRDYFRMLYRDDQFVVIGARDAAYNISLADLTEVAKLSWASNASTVELCRLKGKPVVECQNYIRVLVRKADGGLFVCGTNAFSPKCRHYRVTEDGYQLEPRQEEHGVGFCPHSPIHNSTSTYVDGQLYVGTAADFSGQDPLILRDRLRTDKWDTVSLDDPDFVSSFAMGDHVYFFLRETAVEYINCGKRVYSRVARVCKSDLGGPSRFKHTWTSYVKTRLNCSVSGDFPFYFDEIQATSDVVESSYGGAKNRLIYGVFSTPPNAIGGSAVCAFRLQSVLDAFSGPFKERASLNSNWLPVAASKVPQPRPGQCVNNSKTLPDMTLNFIKTHPLMDEAVGAFFGGPILTRTSLSYRFSAVTVDPRVRLVGDGEGKSHQHVDVLFVGTGEYPPFAQLHISRTGEPRLVASSDSAVIGLPLHRCYTDKITVCGDCVALQDPYCAWDLRRQRCSFVDPQRYTGPEFVQNVRDGASRQCPEGATKRSRLSVEDRRSGAKFGSDQPLSFQSEQGSRRPDRPSSSHPAGAGQGQHRAEVTDGTAQGRHGWGTKVEWARIRSRKGSSDERVQGSNQCGLCFRVGVRDCPSSSETVSDELFTAGTLALAVLITAISALVLGFVVGHYCARRCHKDDVNMPYADTDYTYFDQRQNVNTRLAHDPTLLGEEVTYSEPVLIPTNSMVGTLKKNQTDGTLPLQYSDKYEGSMLPLRGDVYGTHHRQLRGRPLQLEDAGMAEELPYRRDMTSRHEPPMSDGYATTRSVRRVYL